MLNIIDEFTRECLAIRIDRKLNSTDVIDALSDLFISRDVPGHVRSDNGPKFIAKSVREWIAAVGAKTAFIEPGSPWENIARASTRSFATNCSTVRSSTALLRPRSSSKHGGDTTISSGRTHHSDTNHRHRRQSYGIPSHPDRLHESRKQWPKSRLCIKAETGPSYRGRPDHNVCSFRRCSIGVM
jgi:transposase InsO family protein